MWQGKILDQTGRGMGGKKFGTRELAKRNTKVVRIRNKIKPQDFTDMTKLDKALPKSNRGKDR